MSQKVGQQRKVSIVFEKIFSEKVTKGVRMHDGRIQMVAVCKGFKLIPDSSGTEGTFPLVEKKRTPLSSVLFQPSHDLSRQGGGNINSPDLIAFGQNILVSQGCVFNRKFNQLSHTDAGCGQEPDQEIIGLFFILPQSSCQILIIPPADHPVQAGIVLNVDHMKL